MTVVATGSGIAGSTGGGIMESDDLVIVVDLDGTLVLGDTLDEALAGALKSRPYLFFLLPFWLLRGRAYFKQRIARYYIPNPSCLPYHSELLDFIKQQRALGKKFVLATAADQRIAESVAEYTKVFDHVIASDGVTNQSGAAKLAAIKQYTGGKIFWYAGNSVVDIPIWREAGRILVAARGGEVISAIRRAGLVPEQIFPVPAGSLKAAAKLLRPHQWAKNLLLFVSLTLAHLLGNIPLLVSVIKGFVAFSLCASSAYIINDICDIESDRQHPKKRDRAVASGLFSLRHAALLCLALLALSAYLASKMNGHFAILLLGYFVATLNYSLWIKKIVLIDVVTLSLLYTVRIVAGSAAIQIRTTPWLMGFSIFIFLSLALAKRYSELHRVLIADKDSAVAGRGYLTDDIEQLAIFGGASGYISVLVLALYMNSPEVAHLYKDIRVMWLVCPLLIYWISRIWLIARRGELDEDPVIFTLKDWVSYLIGGVILGLLVIAL